MQASTHHRLDRPDRGTHSRYRVPTAASSPWLVSSSFSSSLLLHLSPKEQPLGGCTLLLAVILRLGILALAGFLVGLLMLRSNINERMLLDSLLPPNFQSAFFPEFLGGRVGCCGGFGVTVGDHGQWDVSWTTFILQIGKLRFREVKNLFKVTQPRRVLKWTHPWPSGNTAHHIWYDGSSQKAAVHFLTQPHSLRARALDPMCLQLVPEGEEWCSPLLLSVPVLAGDLGC